MRYIRVEDLAGVWWVVLLSDDGEPVEKMTAVEFDSLSVAEKGLLF